MPSKDAPAAYEGEAVLYHEHPAMFRNHPVGFVLALVLVLAFGIGALILLAWWIQSRGTTLIVTTRRTVLRKGILSRSVSDILNEDVRNIQINQSFLQRLLDVGSIGISSAGQAIVEIQVAGMPHPEEVRTLINQSR